MQKNTKKFLWRFVLLFALIVGVAEVVFYIGCLNRFDLNIIRQELVLPDGYESLDGKKIVLFSDLHMLDTAKDLQNFKQMIEEINHEKPDIILFGGDLLATDNVEVLLPPARILTRMRSLTAKYGVYAVTGNHDWYANMGNVVTREMQQVGLIILDNKSVVIPGVCNLVGVQDEDGKDGPQPAFAMKNIDSKLPTVVLMHRPEYWKRFPESVKLFFAGHTHGGQVNLPFIKEIFLKHTNESDYPDHNYVFSKNRKLFVTFGVGTSWIRVRINCPPEIMIFNCRSKKHETVTQ